MTVIIGSMMAVFSDCLTNRIPNALCMALAACGLIMSGIQNGSEGIRLAMLGMLMALVILYLLFYGGMLGGGDVKLLAAIGAFTGPSVIWIILLSFLFNGITAVMKLLVEHNLWERLMYLKGYVEQCSLEGRLLPGYESGERSRIHFSVGILAAVISCHWAGLF